MLVTLQEMGEVVFHFTDINGFRTKAENEEYSEPALWTHVLIRTSNLKLSCRREADYAHSTNHIH